MRPRAAARVEDAHPRSDPAAQQLIEQVDVDVAELFLEASLTSHTRIDSAWPNTFLGSQRALIV